MQIINTKNEIKTNAPIQLSELKIERGETQKDVNTTVLTELVNIFDNKKPIKVLDLPCGEKLFLSYLKALFPSAELHGADIMVPKMIEDITFHKMDLTREFTISDNEQFDLVTSISGVMMFSNTKSFVENCSRRLKPGGTLVLTNDNSSTIIDRLSFLSIGRLRQFKLVFEDNEAMTQNIPIQELIRLLRNNGIEVNKITYTSFYPKDLKYLPFVLLMAPIQMLYLGLVKTTLPKPLIRQMFSIKQFLYKHYVIYGTKIK